VRYRLFVLYCLVPQECARYIETFKAFENRPASSIMEHTDTGKATRVRQVCAQLLAACGPTCCRTVLYSDCKVVC